MKRILVIQTAKLGDMVCTTPVFRAIKKNFPDTKLFVIGDSVNKKILQGNPHIEEYLEYKNVTVSHLRQMKINVAILLNPQPIILGKMLLAGIPKIIVPKVRGGYSPYSTKMYRMFSLFTTKVDRHFGKYVPQEYLNMLLPLGINSKDTKKELYFSSLSESKANKLLENYTNQFKIIISPSAGNKIKNWGGEKFAKLVDEMYVKWKPAIFIIGACNDQKEVKEMIDNLSPTTKVVDLSMKLDLEDLKAVISKVDMFISVDTGPIYIAEAFDVPTVDIIGPIDESEQPPRGIIHKWVVSSKRKKPLLYVLNARIYDVAAAIESTKSISVEMVVNAVESLYVQLTKNNHV